MKTYLEKYFPRIYLKLREYVRTRHLVRDAEDIARACSGKDLPYAIERVINSKPFRSSQLRPEILSLLESISAVEPRTVCELGCYQGGTLFLFAKVARPDATIFSMDLRFPPERLKAYARFASANQSIQFLAGDSHTQATYEKLEQKLGGRMLDVLFIDGDHSYDGVSKDFEMYSKLVRPGGLIAFHDIVSDFKTRHGVKTKTNTGGVPKFWQELKGNYPGAREFIEDPEQDGFGIGVITVPASGGF